MTNREDQRAAVYGELYASAMAQLQLNQAAIDQQDGVGFADYKACAKWAEEHMLDLMVLGKAQHKFYHVSHHGEIINQKSWFNYYSNILFYKYEDKNGKTKRHYWVPNGLVYHERARINGEVTDGLRKPLYHRDYFTPTGYYDPVLQSFNIAKPFPVFAKNTGRDTRHLYTYIEHIAGKCALWLLAWLRAKMVSPLMKTEIVPIIVSRAQGSGKSTFAEVICKGLFGDSNVLVTDQYDSTSRFNADYADALIVSQEEKEERDRRNPAAALKSRATATTIRKEYKGLDPFYQKSYTEFIVTTNDDVPIKFEDTGDQRRFMVMDADNNFTKKTSALANEVFTKLYGRESPSSPPVSVPFIEDPSLIAQFKHELFTREDIAQIVLRDFPKTDAYARCFTIPRTNESVEIESIMRALAPFIRASLDAKKTVHEIVSPTGDSHKLSDYIVVPAALQYITGIPGQVSHVAVCRPIVFYDSKSNRTFQHSVVERGLISCSAWLLSDYGLVLMPMTTPILGGFPGIKGYAGSGAVARFKLLHDEAPSTEIGGVSTTYKVTPVVEPVINTKPKRNGKRLRVNDAWRVDPNGAFETVNELKENTFTLENKGANVLYMDTFLLESDAVSSVVYALEQERIQRAKQESTAMTAERLFLERLSVQRAEASRLFKAGIVCRAVYSGSKSIHMLIRVTDTPVTIDEYKWLHAYLCTTVSDKLTFDASTQDPARLTRAPITRARVSEYCGLEISGTQSLLWEDFNNVYDVMWRPLYGQWLNRPLHPWETKGRKLQPARQEYQDAMYALLAGTFWTDTQWNGQRQLLFFPAYRLCRMLGYTHDELWSKDGILDGLQDYYRTNERQYWESRESSAIIKQIDDDVEGTDVT
jgi:hypothetical protein